jgi:hypothetical protein
VHLLSLAFLFAQLGMAVHASTHLKADQHPAQSQLCGQCLSFAPLQTMVASGAAVLFFAAVCHDGSLGGQALPNGPQRSFTAFRSRAPPVS